MSDKITSDGLLDARCDFHDLIMELGAAAQAIRGAAHFVDKGKVSYGIIASTEAIMALQRLQEDAGKVIEQLERWRGWATEGGEQ